MILDPVANPDTQDDCQRDGVISNGMAPATIQNGRPIDIVETEGEDDAEESQIESKECF